GRPFSVPACAAGQLLRSVIVRSTPEPDRPEDDSDPSHGYRQPVPPKTPPENRPELARLPAGRHGLPPEFVARNQGERLIVGLAIAVAAKGYDATTVADIIGAAGVSRRTFYKHFDSKQDCFLAALGILAQNIRERVLAEAEAADQWPDRVRLALAE